VQLCKAWLYSFVAGGCQPYNFVKLVDPKSSAFNLSLVFSIQMSDSSCCLCFMLGLCMSSLWWDWRSHLWTLLQFVIKVTTIQAAGE